MKVLKQEDENTRIVQGWYWKAMQYTVRRQRRRWYGWKTVSWLYTFQYPTIEGYADWFDWDENENQRKIKKLGDLQF